MGTQRPPDVAVRGVGTGLWLMAFFTMAWTGISQTGLQGRDHRIVLIIFSLVSTVFVYFGIRLFTASQKFPKLASEEDILRNKKTSRNFGILFGLEGLFIPLVCGLLSGFGHERFMYCGISMVVGLHFYPMARIFHRTIDYYLATWACGGTLTIAYLLFNNSISDNDGAALVGVGMALTTTAYGVNMILEGKKFLGML
jgi:hypothetical protein